MSSKGNKYAGALTHEIDEVREAYMHVTNKDELIYSDDCQSCTNLAMHIPTIKNSFDKLCATFSDILADHNLMRDEINKLQLAVKTEKENYQQNEKETDILIIVGEVISTFTYKVFDGVSTLYPGRYLTKTVFLDQLRLKKPQAVADLEQQLNILNMPKADYDILVKVKKSRNDKFHDSSSTSQRITYLQHFRADKYDSVVDIILKHKAIM